VLASETQGKLFTRNYGNFFPSFFFQHNIKENHSFNISYSRRIWRPGFYDLAPYVIFSDPKTFITGNPALQPSIMDAANAAYMYKNKMVTISYSYVSHPIIQQPKVDENSNKMVTAAFNGRNAQNLSLSLAVPFVVTKWWNMQNNITGFLAKSSSFYKEEINIDSKGFYGNSSQTFLLPKDFSLSVSGYFSTGWVWGLYKSNPMGSLDMGIQKKFAKKKSSLTFNVVNILNSQKAVFYVNAPEQNLVVKNNNIFSYTSFTLSFTKSFGNEKVKEKRDRSTGAEDEKGRAY
jgi:hypothetical protein